MMNAREIFEIDFLQAAKKRDFCEMADIYEEMDRFDSYDDSPDIKLDNDDLRRYCPEIRLNFPKRLYIT